MTGGVQRFAGRMKTKVGVAFITPTAPELPGVDKFTLRATGLRVRVIDRNLSGTMGVMNAAPTPPGFRFPCNKMTLTPTTAHVSG